MGCDIHIIAEVKNSKGHWVKNTDKVFSNPWHNPERIEDNKKNYQERVDTGEITQEEMDNWIKSDERFYADEFQDTPDDNRNYDWFAILADVRNGRGFAGVSTGQGFDVIAQPRGLPKISGDGIHPHFEEGYETLLDEYGDEYTPYVFTNIDEFLLDCSTEWIEIVKRWSVDMHSHSWLTVEDFDNFDWNQLSMKYGVITLDQYKGLRGTNNTPENWCGSSDGKNIITISEETADKVLSGELKELTKEPRKTFFGDIDSEEETRSIVDWDSINVNYSWSVLYSDWFENKIKNVVEPLRKLKEKYGDARIIFGFDN